MGSETVYSQFNATLTPYTWFEQQPENIKVLLYEYYVYKINHKELEKQAKLVKNMAEFLCKTGIKITSETKLEHVSPLIDEKPEYTSTNPEQRQKALDLAIKETLKREFSESSSYDDRSYDSRHGRKGSRVHHRRRDEHYSSSRGVKSSSALESQQTSVMQEMMRDKRKSRSRSRSQEKDT